MQPLVSDMKAFRSEQCFERKEEKIHPPFLRMWTDFMQCCQMNKCELVTRRGVPGSPTPFLIYLKAWLKTKVKYVSKCPTRCNYTQFILSINCSKFFGWYHHPSSGAQITVFTASGTSQPLLLPAAIVEELTVSTPPLYRQVATTAD